MINELSNKIDKQKIDAGIFKLNKDGLLQFGILQIVGLQVERAKIDNKYLKRGRLIHKKIEDELKNKKTPTLFSSKFVSSLGIEDFETEKHAVKTLANYSISGVMDYVGKKNGRTIIFDFKTGQKYTSHALQLGGYIYLHDLDPKTTDCGVVYDDLQEVVRIDSVNALEGFLIALREFENCLITYETFLDLKESQEKDILELVLLKNFYEQLGERIGWREFELGNKMIEKNIKDIKIFNTLISLKKRKEYERVSLDTPKVSEFLKEEGVYEKYIKKTTVKESTSLSFKKM